MSHMKTDKVKYTESHDALAISGQPISNLETISLASSLRCCAVIKPRSNADCSTSSAAEATRRAELPPTRRNIVACTSGKPCS
eukprot:1137566-Pelagomonas_calceolata.AAC.3